MIDCKDSTLAEDILNQGEALFEKSEKVKGFPTLSNLETQLAKVRVDFDPDLEKKLQNIARIKIVGRGDSTIDVTEAS